MSGRLGFTPPDRSFLTDLMRRAQQKFDAMSPAEQDAMLRAQRESYVRGEMGMGSDKDEAEYAAALRDGDEATLERLDREADERVARIKALRLSDEEKAAVRANHELLKGPR